MLRDHPVLDHQGGLDQSGHPRGRLQVAEIGFNGTRQQRTVGVASPAVDFGHGVDLYRVAHGRSGPVRLKVFHVGRRYPRLVQRVFDDADERGGMGDGQARAGAAVVDGRTADHAPDAVAVGLRLAQPLQDHHAASFAPYVAVRRSVEGLALPIRRQHHGIGAQFVDARVQERLHAAREGQVRLAVLQVRHRVMDRYQRRCAGGVHRLYGTHQAQYEGDPAAGAVEVRAAQRVETGGRVGGPGGFQDQHAVLVVADPGVDPGSTAFQAVRVDSRVFQRLPARFQRHPLLRIQQLRFHRRNPEEGLVELVDVVHESAVPAAIADHRTFREERADASGTRSGDALGHRVPPFFKQAPERIQVRRARKLAGHADDRDRLFVHGVPLRPVPGSTGRFLARPW